jgi:hypothetical protein
MNKFYTSFWEAAMRQNGGEQGAAPPEAPAAVEAPVMADTTQESAESATSGNVEPPVEGSAKPPQGLLDRIGQLTRQKKELEERLQQVEAYRQQQYDVPQDDGAGLDPRAVQLEIHRRAQELAQQQQWKDTTDRIWNEGLQKYGDWAPQLNQMAQILGGIPPSLTEAAIESGNPHDVLYHLAKNPDKAAEIAMLPPTRQAVAVAKIAGGLSAPKRVSSAPPPITPKVSGMGSAPATLDDPDISMEEWIKLRNEQSARRRR